MHEYKLNPKINNKDSNMKQKIHLSNVFSNISGFEKGKIYKSLQTGLNLLTKDVKLLEIYANKDIYGRKKKFTINKINISNNTNQNKRFNSRNNTLIRKKKYSILSNPPNLINSNLDSKNNINNSNKKNISNDNKKFNDSRNINYILYKKEANKKRRLTKIKNLKKINLSSCISSETNMETSKNNINSNNISQLPNINNTSPIQLCLFTENNEDKKNLINNSFFNGKYEIPKENYFMKKFPSILNTEKLKNTFNKEELSYSLDKLSRIMQDKNTKIKNRIHLKLSQQNLINWRMRSKLKFTNWKFGISEINKNFVDLKVYDKPEEEELMKRKKFYDVVNGLIDELKHDKEEKEINNIRNKYIKKAMNVNNNNLNKKEKNNDINVEENVLNKQFEIDEALQYIKMRKLNERKKRQLINNIFIKNDLCRNAINRSTELLLKKLEKENKGSQKNIIIEKNKDNEKSKKDSFILINNYNKDKDSNKEEDKKQEEEKEGEQN